MPQLVKLSTGPAECILYPDIGGSIGGWTVNGQEMLRRAGDAAVTSRDPLSMASFPLVPFSNRIGYGKFDWLGETINIEPNFAPEPHAIHGAGWKLPWAVSDASETHCVLRMSHEADGRWPWSFTATQTVELRSDALEIRLEATNLSAGPAPLAFGHHPYFDKNGAHMAFHADRVFMAGDDALPTDPQRPAGRFDFSEGGEVEGRGIDHCYAGWHGETTIHWDNRPLGIKIRSGMAVAVVYIPDDGDAFCFEPVPHINNALNRPADHPAMPVVQPGDSFRSAILMQIIGR